ncbi:hypothetical protein BDW67DRAFT_156294 [Aspergillus spinulosporus]
MYQRTRCSTCWSSLKGHSFYSHQRCRTVGRMGSLKGRYSYRIPVQSRPQFRRSEYIGFDIAKGIRRIRCLVPEQSRTSMTQIRRRDLSISAILQWLSLPGPPVCIKHQNSDETERAEKIAVRLIGPGSIGILGFGTSIDELCHVSLQLLG